MNILEGQAWRYRRRDCDKDSYLIIRKITDETPRVIHITVKNIQVGFEKLDINHLPVSFDILCQDLVSNINTNTAQDYGDFCESYEIWKNENGGVWNIPLKDIIDYSIECLQKGGE